MNIKKFAYKLAYKAKEDAPAIYLALGIIGFGATVVLACKATPKVKEIMDEHSKHMSDINVTLAKCASDDPSYKETEYTEQDAKKDKFIFAVKTGGALVKNYAPAIVVGGLSIASFLASYKILNARYIAASSVAAAVSEAFRSYRKRVVDEFGEEVDRHLYFGTEKAKITELKEDGTTEEKEIEMTNFDKNGIPLYAKFFDEANPQWNKNPEINYMFLRGMQSRLNDKFHAQGYLLLNQVYRALDIPETDLGCEVGWFESHGDKFVDFGIFDSNNERKRAFVNGYEPSILLCFNCVPKWEGDLPKF